MSSICSRGTKISHAAEHTLLAPAEKEKVNAGEKHEKFTINYVYLYFPN